MRRKVRMGMSAVVSGVLPALAWAALTLPAHGENLPAAADTSSDLPAIQKTGLRLPEGWCAEYVARLQAPAELQVPLGEQWRFPGSPLNSLQLCATVWEDCVFLSYTAVDPQFDMEAYLERRKGGSSEVPPRLSITECRDLATGNVLWSTTGVFGRPIVLPGHLFLLYLPEGVVLESTQGSILYRFPLGLRPTDWPKLRQWSASSNFVENWALDTGRNLFGPVLSGKDPVPPDITQWTDADTWRLDEIFGGREGACLLRHGACMGHFFFPNAEDVVFAGIGHNLTYRAVSEDRFHWRQVCTPGVSTPLLWQPPYIVVFSSKTAVTAYRIDDGSAAWIYEFPADKSNGGPVYRFASLTDGILLVTEPLMGLTEAQYVGLPPAKQQEYLQRRSKYLWLTKLDHEGHRLFQQELTVKSSYQSLAISRGLLVLWNNESLVCYGPTTEVPRSIPPDTDPPLDEKQRRLEIEKLHAEYAGLGTYTYNRRLVCIKLGALGDRSMLATVSADLAKASGNSRQDYVSMLGSLYDRRAIDTLIPLIKDESWSVRMAAYDSLRRLTGGPDLSLTEWGQWWNVHKRLYQEP